jgi:chemotaxis protein CheC
MILSALECDALTEIFNHGVGQAAQSLSEIAQEAVILSVPRVSVSDRHTLATQLENNGCRRLCAVRQAYSGVLATDAMLMFPVDQSLLLVQMMVGGDVPLEQLGEMEKDALAEVGNILLNGVVGSMADLLHMEFEGALPEVEQGSARQVLGGDVVADESVLNLEVDFDIAAKEIRGFIAFMLDVKSIHYLQQRLGLYISGALE